MVRGFVQVVRALFRDPAHAVVAILTLALGIGATTAVFCVLDGVLLRPLPYPQAERLVRVFHTAPGLDLVDDLGLSDATYFRLRESGVFDGLALYRTGAVNLSGGAAPERVPAAWVSPSLTETLGVAPILGRPLRTEDARPGADPVALLGERLWRRRFGGVPGVVGERVRIDGVEREIVGVLPEDLRFPEPETRVWLPFEVDPAATQFGQLGIDSVARLPPGTTAEDAAKRADAALAPLSERFPVEQGSKMLEDAGFTTRVVPLRDHVIGDLGASLWIVMSAVGFLLLLSCANVANLFLVRAAGREKELSVRTALGATRRDLVGGFLAEGAVLGLAGGLVGWVLAWAAVQALVAFGPRNLPRLHELGVGPRGLGFVVVVALASGLAVALAPALRLSGRWLASALRSGGRSATTGPAVRRAQDLLVGLQVAITLLLLVGAGLTVQSFWRLSRTDPGFDPEGVLSFRFYLPPEEYPGEQAPAAFIQRVLDQLGPLPGVTSAGAGGTLPLEGRLDGAGVSIEDHPDPPGAMAKVHFDTQASPGYFETLGIPLVTGRTFTRADVEERRGAVVVSESFARHYWPDGTAVGKRIQPRSGEPSPDDWYTIVGVVGDVRMTRMEDPPQEMIYWPLVSRPGSRSGDGDSFEARAMRVVLRTEGDPMDLVPAVRSRVRALDPNLPIADVQTAGALVARATARRAFVMALLALGALAALLVGAVGVYAVVSYLVTLRTREIGVRMALGATRRRVVALVAARSIAVGAAGALCGVAASFLLGRFMGAVLYQVQPHDPWTLSAAVVAVAAAVTLASVLPARRAAGIDPAEVMRAE